MSCWHRRVSPGSQLHVAAIGFAQRTREHAALSQTTMLLFLTKKEKAGDFFFFCLLVFAREGIRT